MGPKRPPAAPRQISIFAWLLPSERVNVTLKVMTELEEDHGNRALDVTYRHGES